MKWSSGKPMNTTLAMLVVVWALLCPWASASGLAHSTIQDSPSTQQQPNPPSPTNPPVPAQDCDKSKDTCELAPDVQQPAAPATPAANSGTQSAQPETNGSGQATPPTANRPTATQKPPAKSAAKKKKHKKKKAASSTSGPRKRVVRDGGTSEPNVQLSPDVPRDQVTRQTTDQLLTSAQTNLKTVSTRTLNANQQATVEQIKMFIEQANDALKEGDLQRGHNLAVKAHLLSDDLVRH